MDYWKLLDNNKGLHYNHARIKTTKYAMAGLRELFHNGVDEMNFVLFSTSGVHGTYNTIEEAEKFINGDEGDYVRDVTFLVIHPRLVAMRYGECSPQNQDDIDFLKMLRDESIKVINNSFS